MDMTVKGGVRNSTANAYLKPVLHRNNLTVITEALVKRVILEGRKAVAVEFETNGNIQQIKASKEVILSAGSIGSPHILLPLSRHRILMPIIWHCVSMFTPCRMDILGCMAMTSA